ncbi:Ppx-GppA-domain-containing protein [Choiromyces venosus 120613-1]|uniref:Ppx-GppA-domain-containing protein n=1 Tax=Choiromyces venosus 120613-1 TaxID=1336337 RepID=A0A3N4JFY5_9PEZI|nr:Ppx-GppA-domain-containing protein [Choiromyces venosus 120613-1]
MAEETVLQNPLLHGLVDIGSNGVRFSISNLHPATARILPTVFQDRAAISLYDAQFSGTTKSPISKEVIDQILTSMRRFKSVCSDFGVPDTNVRVVATEATREAQNSAEFRGMIADATGWAVELLSKSEEARIGAEGVASSIGSVTGLVMDLGGGSTQISWMRSEKGICNMAEKPVSMPYGAAALTKRIETAIDGKAIGLLRDEMKGRIAEAFVSLQIPKDLQLDAEAEGGFTMYLSGGGFRGFGYLLLDKHDIKPYPIPIINGFKAPGNAFSSLADLHLDPELSDRLDEKFQISGRRARQIPAVAFLINTLIETLPKIKTVVFCQGGVREGALFEKLPPEIRAQDPLLVATLPYAPKSTNLISLLLNYALPRSAPYILRSETALALSNLLTYHSNIPKESRASCGLHSTSTGILASAHGLTHETRALLALSLCERWGGEVSDSNLKTRLEDLVGPELAYWARYLGAIARVVGSVYPTGVIREEKLRFFATDVIGGAVVGGGAIVLKVAIRDGDPSTAAIMVIEGIKDLAKIGKKKRNREGYRRKVVLNLVRDLE